MGEQREAVVDGWREPVAAGVALGVVEPVRTATATTTSHHGEILQGVFADADGRLRRGLLSMPCHLHSARASFTPAPGAPLVVEPAGKLKARRAAEATLELLGHGDVGGYLELAGTVPASRGFGSSTCDVLVAVRAVQGAFGRELPSAVIARLAVQAEIASDPLMFGGNPVLFAQRDGIVLEDFGCRLPRLAAIGFGTSATGTGIDTLSLPPAEYTPSDVARFRDLRDQLRGALSGGDPAALGAVATASAELNQRNLPIPGLDRITALIRRTGAAGLQIAHSGDVASLLFDARQPDVERQRERARLLLADLGIKDVWRFTVGGPR
ncbi:kinase [Amycolatopsis sp. NPDC026612]|uniref:GHMP family kinase ATP-binding protein n=1 Tax=Amycolatopsis sp. NPDC026612 TaxID=3155466 RepID=UPI0033F30ACC